jgi:hypothetical protein
VAERLAAGSVHRGNGSAADPGHQICQALNKRLAEAGSDSYIQELRLPHCKECGCPGVPPGVFLRMLFIGYFEGIDSQRGIA